MATCSLLNLCAGILLTIHGEEEKEGRSLTSKGKVIIILTYSFGTC